MARKKLHREPVLKDWAEVNDALRSIHEYEHALTEMGVDMSRRIDAVKAEYTKSAEPLQKRVKQLETDVQEYVEAHREDMAGKSRQLTFGRRISAVHAVDFGECEGPAGHRHAAGHGPQGACKNRAEAGQRGAEAAAGGSSGGCGRVSENHG